MKRVFAILALLGAVSIGAPAWAEEKPAAPTATTSAAIAPAAATTASAEPAPTAPALVANKGDNAWIMTSAALVILMSIPGLALFYGGLVRTKNMLSVLMQVFITFSLISVLWVVYGYSLAFTEGGGFFGVLDKIFLKGITPESVAATFSKGVVVSELAYVIFQGAFAAITCGLIVGAFAERAKFAAILVFMVIWFTLSYLPMAHMVWYWAGPDAYVDAAAGEAAGKTAGFLFQKGALDFAGGTVVHINAAVAGLIGAIVIGKRIGYGRESMAPHSLTFTMIGASLLWFGWFGFNAGSALEASGGAALAMVNTWVATACAAMSWMLAEWMLKGKPSMLGAASGAVAGLVAITPAAGFVGVVGAIVIGLLAGVICLWGVNGLKRMLGADDSLDVFGVHGVGGILGAILTGIFADPALGGTGVYDYVANAVGSYDMGAQVISQLWGVGTVIVWSGIVSLVAFKLVDMIIGLRVPEEEEREGLDITSHGESAYHY
ncbi:ammonium transporter [Accumulibacter sp.]|uniref:Ammonium transporter n=1 Tax=Candidatus Accumulibacter proximus TaxID=2954385 RepID=A0A935PXE6_9PROT|nr:ammonium transporter [Accumulibacter sp.]MBK7673841.1 ammonium transporter [Candidatus Accumulibacter proximus]MBL8373743.1 ammonium transporter [Accumulibacter sp.]